MATIASTPIVAADGVLTIKDATGTPLSYTVAYDMGDFKIGGLNVSNKESLNFYARGVFFGTRDIKSKEFTFSFTAHLIGLLGETGAPTINDVILRKKDWAAAVSTLPAAAGDTFHHTILWTVERSNLGATTDDTFTLKYCELSIDWAEGDGSTCTINGVAKMYSTDGMTIT